MFSTVGSADKNTVYRILTASTWLELHIATLNTPYTIMAPVYFMDNLLSPWGQPNLGEGIYTAAMPADRPLQQIAVKNIGDFAAALIERVKASLASDTILQEMNWMETLSLPHFRNSLEKP